jgi:hypothetical protein
MGEFAASPEVEDIGGVEIHGPKVTDQHKRPNQPLAKGMGPSPMSQSIASCRGPE